MSFLEWNDAFNINIDIIDKDHQKLFALTNDFHDAVKEGRGDDLADHILSELHRYILYHFSKEEGYMKESDYPDFEAHREEHNQLAALTVNFVNSDNFGDRDACEELLNFMKDWLIHHVMGSDRKFGNWYEGLRALGCHRPGVGSHA